MNPYGFFKVAGAIPAVRVGDCAFLADRHIELIRRAAEHGAELVAFPELSLTGYTCGDLFLQPSLMRAAEKALEEVVRATADCPIAAVVGMPLVAGGRRYNCAVAFSQGEILGVVPKSYLPNYGEFYEPRWFASGADVKGSLVELCGQEVPFGVDVMFKINGVECGVEICEDLWVPNPPSAALAQGGARILINLSASPEVVGKHAYLRSLVSQQSARLRAGYLYVSSGFGESSTDLVFGGNILIADQGEWVAESERFSLEEQLLCAEIDVERIEVERTRTNTFAALHNEDSFVLYPCEFEPKESPFERKINPMPFVPSDEATRHARCEEIFQIQAMGLAKRLEHTRCRTVVLGISGGLDSTLALLVVVKAFDKLGLDRRGIYGITMPGFGTGTRTKGNAEKLMELTFVVAQNNYCRQRRQIHPCNKTAHQK